MNNWLHYANKLSILSRINAHHLNQNLSILVQIYPLYLNGPKLAINPSGSIVASGKRLGFYLNKEYMRLRLSPLDISNFYFSKSHKDYKLVEVFVDSQWHPICYNWQDQVIYNEQGLRYGRNRKSTPCHSFSNGWD